MKSVRKKLRLRDGSVHSVTGKPEAYAVSPKISEQDELTAVCIDAEIQTQAPAFGYQKAFADRNGVEIDLKLSEGYPFVSIYQHKEWWIRPAFGTVFSEIPEQSQLVIFKRPEDYLVFLAVSGKENRADLVGWEKGASADTLFQLCRKAENTGCGPDLRSGQGPLCSDGRGCKMGPEASPERT